MDKVTGSMVYYYFICKRKLWYFSNNISMEQNSELVLIGKLLDESSYTKEKKNILIDGVINIDFIGNDFVVHEVKKTKAIEEASIWQLKYYLYYLDKKGIKDLRGIIDYPLIRERLDIYLEDDDIIKLDFAINDIKNIVKLNLPPKVINSNFCKKCSYYDLCYI